MSAGHADQRLSLRARVWSLLDHDHLDSHGQSKTALRVEEAITWLILINVACLILESVPSLNARYGTAFSVIESVTIVIFSIEYVGRLWSCVEHEDYKKPVLGRLAYAFKPAILVDLLAIVPFYLTIGGIDDMRVLRLLRVFRIIRLFRVSRYSRPMRLIQRSIERRREEIVISTLMLLMLMLISASVMYAVEHDAQPEVFSSIPGTLWWAVVTLTTVGYGDVYPITALGRVAAGVIAVLGIGMVALPTGIISSGFVEEFAADRAKRGRVDAEPQRCPHCGKRLDGVDDPAD
ncbi:MAG: ion transporter [Pseudomonadota bacterium]